MRVFIENEKGSRRKNIYDAHTLTLVHSVDVSAAYPFPYGFVLGTIGGDGDAVDCFVLTETPIASGTVIECEPVGLLEQIEDGKTDHKVLAVLRGAPARFDAAAIAVLRIFIAGVFAHVPEKRIMPGRLLGRPDADAYLMQCRDEHSRSGFAVTNIS